MTNKTIHLICLLIFANEIASEDGLKERKEAVGFYNVTFRLPISPQERPKLETNSMKSIENDSNHTSFTDTTGDFVESFINVKTDTPESILQITSDLPEENITTQEILIENQENNNNNTVEFVLQIGTAAIASLAGGGIG